MEEKEVFFASFITKAVGVAWNLVTFLMLPVIMLEHNGIIRGVERSWQLFKKSWGEQVVGTVGFDLQGLIIFIPFTIAAIMLAVTMDTLQAGIYTFLGGIGLMQVISSGLHGVWQAALYHYALSKQSPADFIENDFSTAFKSKLIRHRR